MGVFHMAGLKESLKGKLNEKEIELVPNSFDIVGNIAIFSHFPDELKKKEKMIAEELMSLNKNVHTVMVKAKEYAGKYRTPKLRFIAGKRTKETIHSENGIRLKLDAEKCYFSARTATERMRVAKQVKKGEKVLVMFAGILPFAITIAKHSKAKEIHAIEINPHAYKYGLENIKLNKAGNIISHKGDVRKILSKIKAKFDRILMPLPKSSEDYLSIAVKKLKKGGIIHFYTFVNDNEFPKGATDKVRKIGKVRILRIVKCGNYAPYTHRVCVDFKV